MSGTDRATRFVTNGDVTTRSVPERMVYCWCMARTNIDIDEAACAVVMRRYHLSSKRAAVNFALRSLAAEPMDIDAARGMRGSGWEGDLDELRASRVS